MSEIGRLWVTIGAKTDEFNKGLQGVQQKMQSVGKGLMRTGGMLTAGITVPMIAAGTALLGGAIKAGNFADEILDLSAVTGVHTDQLQRWRYMSVAAGTDSDAVANALGRMNRQMVDGTEFGKRLEETAAGYGVALRDANGKVRDGTDVITDLMMAISSIEDPAERARVGAQAFGRDWEAIAPIVDLGTEAIMKWNEQEVIDREKLEKLNEFREKWDMLKHSLSIAFMEMVGEYIPILTEFASTLGDKLKPIVETLKDKIKALADWWKNLSPQAQKFIGVAIGIVAALGPVLTLLGGLIFVISLLASPIGLIIIAIAAFIAILIYLWNKHEGFRNAVKAIWEGIKSTIAAAVDFVKGIWEKHGESITTILQAAWNQVVNIFETVFAIIGGIFDFWIAIFKGDWQGAWDAAVSIANTMIGFIQRSFENFGKALGVIGDAIKTKAKQTWDNIKTESQTAWSVYKSAAKSNWDAVASYFQGVWSNIRGINDGAVGNIIDRAKTGFGQLLGIVQGPLNALRDFWRGIWAAIKSMLQGDLAGMSSNLRGAFGGMISYIRGVVSQMSGLGRNMVQGLINGIKNMGDSLSGALSNIVSNAIAAAKRALGIKSPSKIFEDIGINVGAGFIDGIENMKSLVADSMQNMVSPQLALAGNGGGAVSRSDMNMTVNHNVNLQNVPATVDGASLERTLVEMLNAPQVKRKIDRVNYENQIGAVRGLGA